jgi:Antirestriction protein
MGATTARRPGKSEEQRAAEVAQLTEQLHAAVGELTSSEAWVRMLAVAAKFHRYSWRNQVLLWVQAEERGMTLSRVAGYRKWGQLGQQVRRGERALAILAPLRRRLSAEEAAKLGKEGKKAYDRDGRPAQVVRGFRVERVFDESQTEPMPGHDPVPGPAAWTEQTGAGPRGLWAALVGIVEGERFVLEHRPAVSGDGGAHGWTDYLRRIVWVNSACDEAEQVRIISHELAHIRCDHEHRDVSRAQGECEADSVAAVICAAVGFDISDSAVDYIATWASRDQSEVLDAALAAIHHAAASVLADLEPGRPADNTTD